MRVKWIEHKGKKILFQDYSNLSGDDLLTVLYETEKILKEVKSPVPILLDYTEAYANNKYMDALKILGKKYDNLILKSASIGVTGIKKILAKGYLVFTGQTDKAKYFDNIEDAKDFLAE